MKVQLTESQIRQITEGAITNIVGSGFGLKPLKDIAHHYVDIFKANKAGYNAVQDDEAAGKPVSYGKAFDMGKEEYWKNQNDKSNWRKILKDSKVDDGDVLQLIYDDYVNVFYDYSRTSHNGTQYTKYCKPCGGGMINIADKNRNIQRRMNGQQKDLHDAMLLLKQIADTI